MKIESLFLFNLKVLSTLLNEMDGVGVRVGASKETKRVAAAAECNAGAAESDDVSGPEVKVGRITPEQITTRA